MDLTLSQIIEIKVAIEARIKTLEDRTSGHSVSDMPYSNKALVVIREAAAIVDIEIIGRRD